MPVRDLDFKIAAARAEDFVNRGATILQKWTCEHCNSRQTMSEENTFFTFGKCEECNGITDIQTRGCGFALIIGLPSNPTEH